jgi:sugar lactone lactonase YvrE
VAGDVTATALGDGGPALAARLRWPMGIVVDAAGNVYVTEYKGHRIRKIAPDGTITTIAGTGRPRYAGDGAPATGDLGSPTGLTLEWDGSLLVSTGADANRVIRLGLDGLLHTVAGTGATDFQGDGGPPPKATFSETTSTVIDPRGNLYIADIGNSRVRRVTPDGIIWTVAGGGTKSATQADGGPATKAALRNPVCLAVDESGTVYFTEWHANRIRKLTPDGIITTVAGTGTAGFSGDGGPALQAQLRWPAGLARDSAGSLFFTDYGNLRIRKIAPDGTISTVAGNGQVGFTGEGGPATATGLAGPAHLAIDAKGNLFFTDVVPLDANGDADETKWGANGVVREVVGVAAPGMVESRPFPTLTGDLDGDGRVAIADALLALRIATATAVPTNSWKRTGDMNGDSVLDVKDVGLILRKAIGL